MLILEAKHLRRHRISGYYENLKVSPPTQLFINYKEETRSVMVEKPVKRLVKVNTVSNKTYWYQVLLRTHHFCGILLPKLHNINVIWDTSIERGSTKWPLFIKCPYHERKGKSEELSDWRRLIRPNTQCTMESWVGSWNRKRVFGEKLVKSNQACSLANSGMVGLAFTSWH